MKNLWIYLFLFISSTSYSQITIDNTIDSITSIGQDFFTVQISQSETKYLFEDPINNTFSLFNMDFSPFMLNIVVPEPFDNWTFQVLYVSRSLFDCDSTNIEYVYEASTSTIKRFYIMRTDGTQLFSKDSVNGPFCLGGGCLSLSDVIRPIRNTSSGTKLFLQKRSGGQTTVFIYSLCGNLIEDVFNSSLQNQKYVSVYPNPSSQTVNFIINLPDNINIYELIIFDNDANELKREHVDSFNKTFSIDMSNLSNGIYYYSFCTKNKLFQSGKFLLTK
jgi:hypothetical protein